MTIHLYAARGRVPGAWPRPFVSQRQFHRPFRQRACALHTRPIAHAHLPPVWGPAPSLPSFATQFCPNCTLRGLRIEPARARQLVGVAGKNIENPRSHGLWATRGEVTFRVVNQTAKCYGPPIIITRDAKSAEALDMPEVPRQWLTKDGWLHLSVSRGTLIPTANLRGRISVGFVPDSQMVAENIGVQIDPRSDATAVQHSIAPSSMNIPGVQTSSMTSPYQLQTQLPPFAQPPAAPPVAAPPPAPPPPAQPLAQPPAPPPAPPSAPAQPEHSAAAASTVLAQAEPQPLSELKAASAEPQNPSARPVAFTPQAPPSPNSLSKAVGADGEPLIAQSM